MSARSMTAAATACRGKSRNKRHHTASAGAVFFMHFCWKWKAVKVYNGGIICGYMLQCVILILCLYNVQLVKQVLL